jgi:hypothetical protein
VDVADGGNVVYTTSTWWEESQSTQVRTLNVVRLDETVATLVTAIEIPSSANVQVEHGIAYVTAGVSQVHEYLMPEGHTHQYYTYSTTLRVIVLWPSGSPIELATYSLQGSSYRTIVKGDTVMLASSGSYDVLALRVCAGTRVEVLGLYELNTLICSFEALGDRIYVAQGIYGASVLATG